MSTDRLNDTLIDVPRGLTNVAVATTTIGQVKGNEGFYQYREYSAVDLARSATFEQAWHLLVLGSLPDEPRPAALTDVLGAEHDRLVRNVVRAVASSTTVALDPITGLKAALPLVSRELGLGPVYDGSPEQRTSDAIVLAALTPRLLAAFEQVRKGGALRDPEPGAGLVAGYLEQVTGAAHDAAIERALSAYLVAAMEHGFNASTFTARVIASTGADAASALAGALGSLTGPLHGGAPARALDTLDEIQRTGANPERWLRTEISEGRRIMGFGHPVYRTVDPRSRMLKQIVSELGGPRVSSALAFEETAERVLAELKPGRRLHANVEFYASVLMERCGLPRDMFTATFAVGRVVGWSAHILEQAVDSKIIRPSARFIGTELS